MRRRVVRQNEDRFTAVLDECARHAVEEIRLHAPQAVEILLDRVHRHFRPASAELGQPIVVAVPPHDVRIFRPMPDRLAKHRGNDAIWRPLQQLPGEAAADAVAHIKEFADAEMVHQPELVVGECVPRILDRNRTGRLAAIGVALVHRDAVEVVFEFLHRVEHCGRPIADPRVQAPAGGDQQRKAGAGLLVADADVAFLIERHGSLSLHCVSVREFSAIFASAQPRCADFLLS